MKESSHLVEVYFFYEVVLGRVGLTNYELTSSCQGNKSPLLEHVAREQWPWFWWAR